MDKVESTPSLTKAAEKKEIKPPDKEFEEQTEEKVLDYRPLTLQSTPHLPKTAPSFKNATPDLRTYSIKLGWIQGVLIPCLLNIWGVMLFLRIAWIVAQAGIGFTMLIIFLSGFVCIITTLSLSAICTNGRLQGGGIYFLVSRSLGAEFGASVGLIFAFANSVAASMNTIGFCESFNVLLKSYNIKLIDNAENDTRIIGGVMLLIMCGICAVGMDWETKTQNVLIVTIVIAILNFYIGAVIGPKNDRAKAEGFVGISVNTIALNFVPDYRYDEGQLHNFFSVFAMYFPAVTGVQCGANICGDLKDPASAIPKGTLLALLISITCYLGMMFLSGSGALRDASGNISDVNNLADLSSCKPNCPYGLHNNYEIMHLMALWSPLIYLGCWAATLSTALTNLLAVPRLIKALGIDQIYPGLHFFAKSYGKYGEPYRGYVLVFIMSLMFLLIADLNRIAPLITNFYLASYALINFCTFHAAYYRPLSWRPTFQCYNRWISLGGCIMCVTIMVIVSWVMALITTFIFLFLYLLVFYRKPETTWSGSADAQHYKEAVSTLIDMSNRIAMTKTFNPQVLILAGAPRVRDWLLDMGMLITTSGSFMIVAELSRPALTGLERKSRVVLGEEWLRSNKSRGFYVLVDGFNADQGLRALLQCSGLGRFTPNLLLVGFQYEWRKHAQQRLVTYVTWLYTAFEFEWAVAVLRMSQSLHPPRPSEVISQKPLMLDNSETNTINIMPEDSNSTVDSSEDENIYIDVEPHLSKSHTWASAHKFRFKHLAISQNSTLDAWWLYDDGGMNILLPYIISKRGQVKMDLRVFILPGADVPMSQSFNYMKKALEKYRIQYQKLTVVEGIFMQPHPSTWEMFHSFIKDYMTDTDDPCGISEAAYNKQLRKTTKHLRLRELMLEYSSDANLIILTLPYPRLNSVPAALYMAWLEIMTRDMPTTVLVRGKTPVIY